jgi:hypothetical protein
VTPLRKLASTTALALYTDIQSIRTERLEDGIAVLDGLARNIWRAYGDQSVSEGDAEYLISCIDRRRPPPSARTSGVLVRAALRASTIFKPRECRKRKPEEWQRRRERRRMLGGSSALPDTLRAHFTEGERSVLCVVAGEVKRSGACDLSLQEIGDRAGVGRTTCQNALHEARRLLLVHITERPQHGRKNLPNIIKITSREWLSWIKRAPSAASGIGSKTLKTVNPSKTQAYSGDDDDRSSHADGSQRGQPSTEAIEFAAELERIAGYEGEPPPSWRKADPANVVQGWFDVLKPVGGRQNGEVEPLNMVRNIVFEAMKKKPDKQPPVSPRYFTPPVERLAKELHRLREQLQAGRRMA